MSRITPFETPLSFKVRPRLSSLLTAGVCSVVLLTVLCIMLLVDHFAIHYAGKMAEQRLQQLSWQMRDSLNLVLQKAVGDVRLVSQLTQVRAGADPAATRSVLDELQTDFPDYAWIGLTDADGIVFAATRRLLEGQNVSSRPWFQSGKISLSAGDYHPAVLLASSLPQRTDPWRFVDVSVPVLYPNGSLRGVMGVHLSWSWARELANKLIAPTDQQYAVDILVVRKDGLVLLGPPALVEHKLSTASLSAAQTGHSGASAERWADGTRYITGYAQTGRPGDPATLVWSVLVRQPEAQVQAAARELEHNIIWVGALLGLALAMCAATLARHLGRPLYALSKALESRSRPLAEGQAALPIPVIDTFHEAHVLSRTLCRMVQREASYLLAVHAMNEQLELTVQARTADIARKANELEQALTRQLRTQLQLHQRTADLKAVLDHAPDAFIALDGDALVIEWNRQAELLLGWHRAETLGRPLADPALRQACQAAMERYLEHSDASALHQRIELDLHQRDGAALPVEASMAHVPRADGHCFIIFLHDISERRSLFAALENMALSDPLTQLPNRRALMPALTGAMARSRRQQRPLALCFLDLDGFKQVNDRYGHDAGDELLRLLARRMLAAVRHSDTVARLGGDEFIILLEMVDQAGEAHEIAQKLLHALRLPFELSTGSVSLSASIGIALHQPNARADVERLLSRADQAMYVAKNQGKNRSALADPAESSAPFFGPE